MNEQYMRIDKKSIEEFLGKQGRLIELIFDCISNNAETLPE